MQHATRLLVLTLIMGLMSACGGQPHRISGHAPLLDIDGLERQDDQLVVILAIRNLNDQTAAFKALNLRLRLDDQLLVETTKTRSFDIPARSRERIRIETTAQASGLSRLDALGSGDPGSLRWELTAVLTDQRGRKRSIDNSGWLHAVPGQPHRFR